MCLFSIDSSIVNILHDFIAKETGLLDDFDRCFIFLVSTDEKKVSFPFFDQLLNHFIHELCHDALIPVVFWKHISDLIGVFTLGEIIWQGGRAKLKRTDNFSAFSIGDRKAVWIFQKDIVKDTLRFLDIGMVFPPCSFSNPFNRSVLIDLFFIPFTELT